MVSDWSQSFKIVSQCYLMIADTLPMKISSVASKLLVQPNKQEIIFLNSAFICSFVALYSLFLKKLS